MKKIFLFLLLLPFMANAEEQKVETKQAEAEDFVPVRDSFILQLQPDEFVFGRQDAQVTVIEYASYSCVHCANFKLNIFPKLKEEYIDTGLVKFVARSFLRNAQDLHATMTVACAEKQLGREVSDKFRHVLFDTQDKWAFSNNYIASLQMIAALGGMSEESFKACLADKALEEKIIANSKYASEKMEINSTPTLVINDKKYNSGDYEYIQGILEPYIKREQEKE